MSELFFERPILNSLYPYPARYWELDADGQPTQQIIETRRPAKLVTPVPKPRRRRQSNNHQHTNKTRIDIGHASLTGINTNGTQKISTL